MSALPKGAASDKDIEIAMKPFPSSTQNKEYIASYLRGMAKLAAFKSYQEEERADYLAANKGIDAGFNKVWAAKMADEEFRDSVAKQFDLEWLTKEKQDKQKAKDEAAAEATKKLEMQALVTSQFQRLTQQQEPNEGQMVLYGAGNGRGARR